MPASKPPARRSVPLIRRDTDYAFRAMVHLACAPAGPVAARALSAAQAVPLSFSQKILRRLARANLVAARMGPGGGFVLARPAGRISMMDIVAAIQGPPLLNHCVREAAACRRRRGCPVNPPLRKLQGQLDAFLAGHTLHDILPAQGAQRRHHARSR